MQHTYFYQTCTWQTEGIYYDDKGNAYAMTGIANLIKNETQWSLDGYMEVQFETPVRFTSTYQLMEADEPGFMRFRSYNPSLGMLSGILHFVGNYILSGYVSDDEIYSGTETLAQISEDIYENVGIAFKDGKRMSAWTARLYTTK